MARYSHDGMTRVEFVPAVADKTAPTVIELTAGTPLTIFINKDGLTVPSDQNMVDDNSLAETFDAQTVGSFGGSIELTMKRDNSTTPGDTAWDLIEYALEGFLVVRRGVPTASAWTAAQKVEVYPVIFHEPVPSDTSSNEQATFSANAAVTSQPALKAAVAA